MDVIELCKYIISKSNFSFSSTFYLRTYIIKLTVIEIVKILK